MNEQMLIYVVVGVVAILLALQLLLRRSHPGKAENTQGRQTTQDVERLIRSGHKIAAIKVYRTIHGCGLKEAKEAVDKLADRA